MKPLSIEEITNGIDGQLLMGERDTIVAGVSRDSRQVGEKDLFFSLIGENQDGHQFIPAALKTGCKNFIVSKKSYLEELKESKANVILVKDTTKALGLLARYYLSLLNIPIVGITGSTGKTSTKDMIAAVLGVKYKVGKTQGNYNNHIGMPLTILDFEEDTQVGVLEMGMDRLGEIDYLASIARPKIGVITNIGVSHLEHLKTRENIFKAKMEITRYFNENDTLIAYEGDFLRKEKLNGKYSIMLCGEREDCHIKIGNIVERGERGIQFSIYAKEEEKRVNLPILGVHNGFNGSLAIGVGLTLGLSLQEAVEGLESVEMTGQRLDVIHGDSLTIIDDCYNASPDSMKSALQVTMALEGSRKIAILGDMFELGDMEKELHKEVGTFARELGLHLVVGIGTLGKSVAEGAGEKGIHFQKKEEFLKEYPRLIEKGDCILVKASRGMHLEEIVTALEKEDWRRK